MDIGECAAARFFVVVVQGRVIYFICHGDRVVTRLNKDIVSGFYVFLSDGADARDGNKRERPSRVVAPGQDIRRRHCKSGKHIVAFAADLLRRFKVGIAQARCFPCLLPLEDPAQILYVHNDCHYPFNPLSFFTMVYVNINKLLMVLIILISVFFIALIGLSRIKLGEHYPSDIIGGYVFGTSFLTALIYLYNFKRQKA
ncbi:MAG: phosphatase PAP2 family protein [Proteobacteria bacterium]|nr:phosphatase PAP2 family protein [Pseudomonadota bacterium]